MLAVEDAEVLPLVRPLGVLLDLRPGEGPLGMLGKEGVRPGLHLGTKGNLMFSIFAYHQSSWLTADWIATRGDDTQTPAAAILMAQIMQRRPTDSNVEAGAKRVFDAAGC